MPGEAGYPRLSFGPPGSGHELMSEQVGLIKSFCALFSKSAAFCFFLNPLHFNITAT
jgi:hypothetical protein